jgi:hypothetical protein
LRASSTESVGGGPPTTTPEGTVVLGPGLVVEYVPASIDPAVDAGDRLITLVRIDPVHYRFRLLTAAFHGSRPAPQWARDFNLTGVINASMFVQGDRSTGLMVDGDIINNGAVNPRFGAFFALDPTGSALAPVAMFGRECSGFDLDALRRDYRVLIQNYRLLDCQRRAIRWKDTKQYSVAAVGVDRDGRVVLLHSRTPYRMRDFNTMIAEPSLGLTAAMFVEGGPEASLYVDSERGQIERIGSWEDRFSENDTNSDFWPIPNVIGFLPVDGE